MFESYNPYNPYGSYYNYNQQVQPQMSRQAQQQMYKPQNTAMLQGKVVDSLEVVKATDIPLDGSTSYFALADGTAIVTKQLQQDGTSKMTIYRPVLAEEKPDKPQYVTQSDLKAQLGDFNPKDIKDIKDELKSLKKKIRDISEDMEEKKEA